MPQPIEGKKAPEFMLAGSDRRTHSLKAHAGKAVVLYFYPKDDTPGCTVEACEFGGANAKMQKAGAVILGVSPDGLKAHEKFIKKFELPFTLLADEDHAVCEKYGVWVEKSMYGKTYMGVQRATFLIKDGVVKKAWPKVKPEGHAAEVLEALKAI
jgi:peroxiredoxin Q/BCP